MSNIQQPISNEHVHDPFSDLDIGHWNIDYWIFFPRPLMPWLTDTPAGAVLNLRLVPRASKNSIQGEHGDALKSASAPRRRWRRNAALFEFLAETFDLPRARVQLLLRRHLPQQARPAGGRSSSSIRSSPDLRP
jgi:hypothetical protein